MAEHPSDGNEAEVNDLRLGSFSGLGSPQYLPDELAPPVDRERLCSMVRKQLPERSVRTLLELTTRFRCWQNAYVDVLVGELALAPKDAEDKAND